MNSRIPAGQKLDNNIPFGKQNLLNGIFNLSRYRLFPTYEKEGCVVQSLIVIDGNYTLDQLHDMANYGIGLQKECVRPIYISGDTLRFIQELMDDPQKREELQQELNRRLKSPK